MYCLHQSHVRFFIEFETWSFESNKTKVGLIHTFLFGPQNDYYNITIIVPE